MNSGRSKNWDVLAAIAAATALVMIGLYIGLIGEQGGRLAVWFVGGLAAAAILAIYGAARSAPRRALALAVSGGLMAILGLLGILSIGLPILVAGIVALVAAGRAFGALPRSTP